MPENSKKKPVKKQAEQFDPKVNDEVEKREKAKKDMENKIDELFEKKVKHKQRP